MRRPTTQNPRVLAIVGPTAVGKSALALRLAMELDAEIVSIDSGAVYRGMDLGTDKPSLEDRERVPHHMVDIVEASGDLSVAEFQVLAREAIARIAGSGRIPLLVGGSGLYFRAVVDPLSFPPTDPEVRARLAGRAAEEGGPETLFRMLQEADPEAAARIEIANTRRVIRALEVIEITGRRFSEFHEAWQRYDSIYDLSVAGLSRPREELLRRCDERVDRLFEAGLVDEVKALEAGGCRASLTSVQALGYAQVLEHLDGAISLDEAIEQTKRRTRRFARRQLTWFNADPRISWFHSDPEGAAAYLRGKAAA